MSAIAPPGNLNGRPLRIVTTKYNDGTIQVDDELSLSSTNPVQNKVITSELCALIDYTVNLNTQQVYLADDLVFSGNYTLGLKKLTPTDTWTAPKGMSLHDMLVELFTGTKPVINNYYVVHCEDLSEIDLITDTNIKDKSVNYYVNEPDKLETICTSKYIAIYISTTSSRQGIDVGEVGLGLIDSATTKYKCFIAGAKRKFNLSINTPITYL